MLELQNIRVKNYYKNDNARYSYVKVTQEFINEVVPKVMTNLIFLPKGTAGKLNLHKNMAFLSCGKQHVSTKST